MGWGAVHGITNNLAGRPLGCGFVPVGRALWSCPATRAVLCVGRFLRGCLADKYVGWLSLWSALPPPSAHASFLQFFRLFSSLQAFRKHYYKNIVSGSHLPTPVHVIW